ncbi:MAG: hypothetical protein QXL16_00520 [Candidatus Micrarchaeaceae archaeon]
MSIILYLVLASAIILYAYLSKASLGFAIFVIVILVFAIEAIRSLRESGLKNTIRDFLIAIFAAILLIFLSGVALGTYAPFDAVASCSMLPTLSRGELVILQGIKNYSLFVKENRIPVVDVNSSYFEQINSSFGASLAYFPVSNGKVYINGIVPKGSYGIYLFNTKCMLNYIYEGYNDIAACIVKNSPHSEIKYSYSILPVRFSNGSIESIVATNSITIGNYTIEENYSNPIIVYKTTNEDYFSGDIIHRVVAALKVGNEYYFLTKGDNNPFLDIEFANQPVSQEYVVGRVIGEIPFLGYLRLIISGQFQAPQGCNETIIH